MATQPPSAADKPVGAVEEDPLAECPRLPIDKLFVRDNVTEEHKTTDILRVYPPHVNCLLSVSDHCLRSQNM
jgi:hypothetical protein